MNPVMIRELDRMRRQEILEQVQHYMLVREIESAQGKHKRVSPLRAILAALFPIIWR